MSRDSSKQEGQREQGNASKGPQPGEHGQGGPNASRKDGTRQRGQRSQHGADDEVKIGEAGARTTISGIDGR